MLSKNPLTYLIFLACFSNLRAGGQGFKKICDLPVELRECSGLVSLGGGLYLTHNDGGNNEELFVIESNCSIQRRYTVGNLTNHDWEDIAIDTNGNLYIGDFGNNDHNRRDLNIGLVKSFTSISADTLTAVSIKFTFSDQKLFPPSANRLFFDCEAMAIYNDSVYLITKNWSSPFTGQAKLYVLPAKEGTHVARLVDSVNLGSSKEIAWVTGMDVRNRELILIGSAYAWHFGFGAIPRFDTLLSRYEVFPISQKEGICFDGSDVMITDEETGGFGSLYVLKLSLSVSDQSRVSSKLLVHYNQNGIVLEHIPWSLRKCELWSSNGIKVWEASPQISHDTLPLYWHELNVPVGVYWIRLIGIEGYIMAIKVAKIEE